MSRAQRLLQLLQNLRCHRFPVTGQTLADELGVSLRTLYRDIAALQQQGACIDGEPGLGYVLQDGYLLPPLMFSENEIEALVLGARWVKEHGGEGLDGAAKNALAKISAVLPKNLKAALLSSALLVGPSRDAPKSDKQLMDIRHAIKSNYTLNIIYVDKNGIESQRVIWPFAVGFFNEIRVVAAWCELRQSFRHFRADRISRITITNKRYPKRQQVLFKQWRESEGIPLQ